MIELHINGVVLPVPPDEKFTRMFQSTLFTRESDAYDFTTSFDIPLTDTVMRAFGNPQDLNTPTLNRTYAAQLIIDGIWVSPVTLKLLKPASTIDMVASISIYGNYSFFAQIVAGMKLADLTLGGIRTIGQTLPNVDFSYFPDSNNNKFKIVYKGVTTPVYLTKVASGQIIDDFCMYQAWDYVDYTPGTDNTTTVNVINNYMEVQPTVWSLQDPVKVNIIVGLNEVVEGDLRINGPGYTRYHWVPYFRLAYVIRKCFEDLGFSVTTTVLNDAGFQSICLHNTFSINACAVSESVDGSGNYTAEILNLCTTINAANHMPDMTILDFLTEVGKKYNLQYNINPQNMSVSITCLGTVVANGRIIDITGRASPLFEVNTDNTGNYINGYILSYETDPNDAATTIKTDVGSYPFVGKYFTFTDLAGIPSPGTGTMAFVYDENAFYQYSGTEWDFYADNLQPFYTNGNLPLKSDPIENVTVQEVTTKVIPVVMRRPNDQYLLNITEGTNAVPYGHDWNSLWNLPDFTNGLVHAGYEANSLRPRTACGVCGDNLLVVTHVVDNNNGNGHQHIGTFKTVSSKISLQPHICRYVGMGDGSGGYPMGNVSGVDTHPDGLNVYWFEPGITLKPLYNYDGNVITHIAKDKSVYALYWQGWAYYVDIPLKESTKFRRYVIT